MMPLRPLSHPKKRGEWVELLFLARAAALGLTVCKPWGDSARYDFILDCGLALFRVQVKSTSQRRGAAFLAGIDSRPPGRRRPCPYTSRQVDFFAVYIIPEDVWYILPLQRLTRARTSLFLNPSDPRNRYSPFLEAWHLLGART